ncbi:MAG TPA: hypothetical protein VFJ13_09155 [Paracoccaceae bacterium]|nr:hypothetical protein [Paracoccaceae bacterium]
MAPAFGGLLALSTDARGPMLQTRSDDRDASGYTVTEDGIAVVPVLGPLLTCGDWLTSLLGATDYGTLGRMLAAAFAEPSARAVLLEMDPPDGAVGGPRDRERGRPALRHPHRRGWLDRHSRRPCRRERRRCERGPEVESRADVDALHAEFCALIARNQHLTPETVRPIEATIWRGRAGIAAGFVGRIGTLDQALADFGQSLDPPPGRAARLTPTRPMQKASMTEQSTSVTASTEQSTVTEPPADSVPAKPSESAPQPGPAAAPRSPRPRPRQRRCRPASGRIRRDSIHRCAGGPARRHSGCSRCHAARRRPGGVPQLGARCAGLARRGQRRRLRRPQPGPGLVPAAGSPIIKRARERAAAAQH